MITRRHLAYTAVAVFLSIALVAGLSIYMSVRTERKWCSLISTLDEAYSNPATPPTTPIGRQIARDVAELRHELGCS